jgi:diguanylate cyclase (GGDEF)-like protein
MSSLTSDATQTARNPKGLDTALGKSREIKDKVDAVADGLEASNGEVKDQIAKGATTLNAAQALQQSEAVEAKVDEVADDLEEVTADLAQGVNEVKVVEQALCRSRAALAESEQALAVSRHAERVASERAMHDQRTGLPNRALFDDRLAQAIAGAERHGWKLAVMFLDLDRFKQVNDTHGHAVGDEVLKVVAQRLQRLARNEDTVCRNGGDEFLVLLIDPGSREDLTRIAGLIRRAVATPVPGLGQDAVITPSIGIALFPEHGTDGDTLIAGADMAMYRAKQRATDCEFHQPSLAAVPDFSQPRQTSNGR